MAGEREEMSESMKECVNRELMRLQGCYSMVSLTF